ncbi:AbrB/MazE/SpoVT family DNA-binding domain-containing protein [Enterococcus sp. AZ126]|uniref:AbrB/MazE/SpoVT family DNA-binding domain-containing protein n=1 Tax=Enterococcus sp. AZ126 TaxID=2774635 RepID=UPI003F29A2D4
MQKIKVRKIGNSLGIILPKDSGIAEGEALIYQKNGSIIQLDLSDAQKKYDRKLIEDSFKEFENNNLVTEAEMLEEFGRYGWGK